MRRIVIRGFDQSTAEHVAGGLLQDALVLGDPHEETGLPTVRYRAAWAGSPTALGALRARHGAELEPTELARTLIGLDTRGEEVIEPRWVKSLESGQPSSFQGVEIRRLGQTSAVLELPAPGALAREWLEGDSARQAEIERALFESGEAALERLRRAVPLISDGARRTKSDPAFVASRDAAYAQGLAGAVILHVPDEQEPNAMPNLEARVLVLGAQRADGSLAGIDLDAVEQAEAAAVEAAAHRRAAVLAAPVRAAPGERLRAAEEDLVALEGRVAALAAKAPDGAAHLEAALETQREHVAALRAEFGATAEPTREPPRAELPPDVKRIGRGDVTVPRSALERLRVVLHPQVADALAVQATHISAWLERQPDEHVRARHEQLGAPDAGVDRPGALELRQITAERAKVNERIGPLEQKIAQAGRGRTPVDVLSPAELDRLDALYRRSAELNEREEALYVRGGHPARWVADLDHVARAAAHADELAIRREIGLRQEAELSVARPPDHIVELLGDKPDREAPHRPEWEALTRDVEYQRIAALAAARDGVAPPSPDARAQRDLDRRVDRLRHERGMPPLGQGPEAAFDPPDIGM